MVESAEIKKIGQNLKYDYQIFRNYGITMGGIAFDCMIAAYLIDPGKRQYGLDRLAEEFIGCATTPIEKLIGKGKEQTSFAATDIVEAARLFRRGCGAAPAAEEASWSRSLPNGRSIPCSGPSRCRSSRCWPNSNGRAFSSIPNS